MRDTKAARFGVKAEPSHIANRALLCATAGSFPVREGFPAGRLPLGRPPLSSPALMERPASPHRAALMGFPRACLELYRRIATMPRFLINSAHASTCPIPSF